MHRCKCKPECEAEVHYKNRMYALGHNPASHVHFRNHKGYMITNEVRKRMSAVWHKTHMKNGHGPRWQSKHTDSTKLLMSQVRKDQLRYGTTSGWVKGKRRIYKGNGIIVKMRSWWEVKFAYWLDGIGVKWLYEPKSFFVGDEDWGGFTYTPDFYLPNQHIFVEIKGWLTAAADWKMERFRMMYPTKHLWMFRGKHLKGIV